ncbi:MAG: hypothetical protein H0X25_23505 [Acidobacteriales bacterium]|nr:hypothetical protein [Terriglobales bacterium]
MQSKVAASTLLCLSLLLMASCGGSSSSGSSGTGGVTPGGGLNTPSIVTVSAGQTTSGTNIAVPSPASSPAPNAENLGVGNSATNTEVQVTQGSTNSVLLFGPGLSGNMTVSITGPGDVSVSNVQGITATDGTPGISFTAAVSSSAALGGRTVLLQNTSNDITAYSGGLEVIP